MNRRNMGKESRLRNPKPQSRYEYTNGDKKFYDRDAPQSGTDSDVWDLTLYFEQQVEANGFKSPGRPVVYTELYHRISKDENLAQLLRSEDTSLTAPARSTDGIYGTDDKIVAILKSMMDLYFNLGAYEYNY